MERSGGRAPRLCQSQGDRGLHLVLGGRRLRDKEVLTELKGRRGLDITNLQKPPKERFLLVVYPPKYTGDLPQLPELWQGDVFTAHHEDPDARGFLKHLGHLHGGLGVPLPGQLSFYLCDGQRFLRFASVGELEGRLKWEKGL
jgi:hypothetical protein